MPTLPNSLKHLVDTLLKTNSPQERYQIIESTKIPLHDVEPYRYFNALSYGRNLIYDCQQFEIILLCWQQGQTSDIHDHGQSDCAMHCLDGSVEEIRYRSPKSFETLQRLHTHVLQAGDTSFINNACGLHQIKNIEAGSSMTLHVYFPAIQNSLSFDKIGNSRISQSVFTSKYGVLLKNP